MRKNVKSYVKYQRQWPNCTKLLRISDFSLWRLQGLQEQ